MSPKSEKRPQKDPFWTLFAHSSPTWPPSIKPPTQVFFSRALPPYISLLEPKSPTKTPKKAILSQNAQKRPPKRTYPPISRQPGHLQPPNKAQSHFQSRIHHISFYILHSHPTSHPKTRQNPKNAPNAPPIHTHPPISPQPDHLQPPNKNRSARPTHLHHISLHQIPTRPGRPPKSPKRPPKPPISPTWPPTTF